MAGIIKDDSAVIFYSVGKPSFDCRLDSRLCRPFIENKNNISLSKAERPHIFFYKLGVTSGVIRLGYSLVIFYPNDDGDIIWPWCYFKIGNCVNTYSCNCRDQRCGSFNGFWWSPDPVEDKTFLSNLIDEYGIG